VESYENNIKRTMGGISFDGNMKIIDQYGTNNSSGMGTYMCWILYGDPTLTVRNAVPTDMGVSHAPVLTIGQTAFEVLATNGEGARATLTVGNEILGSAVIENGSAYLEFDTPQQVGEATLTVFGYNKITYIATVNIIAGGEDGPVEVTTTASPSIIARGTSTTLNAQATGGNWYFSYQWSPAESLNQSNIKSPTANPTTTTTYTCTVTSGTHSNVDSCTVIVVCPPSNLNATAVGNEIQLTWDAPDYADSYKVYRNSHLIAEGITETSYTNSDLEPGAYSYRVATTYQGIDSPKSGASAAIIAAPLSVTAEAEPAVIALGGTTTLRANVTGGSNPTCVWTPSETLSDPTDAETSATPMETTTYTVTVTSGEETVTAQTTVQVVTAPANLSVNADSDDEHAIELLWDAATLASSYRIYHNNMLMASNVTDTHYLAENLSSGNHCFRVTAVYQGVESPKSEEACMEINTCIPPLDFEALYYWYDSEFGTKLIWTKDQSVNMDVVRYNIYRGTTPEDMEKIASQVNVPYNYHYEYRDVNAPCGEYYYMVGANYGEEECFTEAILVSITSVSDNAARLGIYPNPTQGNITITTEGVGELRIVNSLGQTLIQTELEHEDLHLDLAPFGKGIYMVIVSTEQGVATKKIIVE